VRARGQASSSRMAIQHVCVVSTVRVARESVAVVNAGMGARVAPGAPALESAPPASTTLLRRFHRGGFSTVRPRGLKFSKWALGLTARAGGLTERAGGLTERAGGLTERAGGLTERAGGLTERAGDLTVRAGGLTARAGGLTVRAGGLTVWTGGLTVWTGGLTVWTGGLTVRTGGLTVRTGVWLGGPEVCCV